jgi:predicted nucleic acid-binding protein
MGKIRDAKRRKVTEQIYNKAIISKVALSAQTIARARELESKGLGAMDARHLATAEAGMADYLLTTDIDFIKKCAKPNLTTVKVINPLNF